MLLEMHEDGHLSRDNPKGVGVCVYIQCCRAYGFVTRVW